MDGFRLTGMLAASDDYSMTGLSMLEVYKTGGESWLLAGSSASGAVTSIHLGDTFTVSDTSWTAQDNAGVPWSGGVSFEIGNQDFLMGFDRMTARVTLQQVDASAGLATSSFLRLADGGAVKAAQMNHFDMDGATWLVGVDADRDGISLYRLGQTATATRTDEVRDTAKSHVSHVSDIVTVNVGRTHYIVAASAHENGMTSYSVGADGSLQMVDSIGTQDGLWSTGLADLTAVEVGGETYMIGVGAQSGTLAAVRINPVGVFFVADVEIDDRNSRFEGVSAVDTFTARGRDFVIVGGTDGGISMFELMPGGTFFHHTNAVQTIDWNIGCITEITAHASGDEVKVFLAGAGDGGLAELSMSLADLGTRWAGTRGNDAYSGTAGHDMISGGSGDDRLSGGVGDDVLHAGTGEDRLAGGAGADVFIFTADGGTDRIEDFELGIDRIDLSDWGMIHDISALTISSHNIGARIQFQDEEIRVISEDGEPIKAHEFTQDDFIF